MTNLGSNFDTRFRVQHSERYALDVAAYSYHLDEEGFEFTDSTTLKVSLDEGLLAGHAIGGVSVGQVASSVLGHGLDREQSTHTHTDGAQLLKIKVYTPEQATRDLIRLTRRARMSLDQEVDGQHGNLIHTSGQIGGVATASAAMYGITRSPLLAGTTFALGTAGLFAKAYNDPLIKAEREALRTHYDPSNLLIREA